VLLYAILLALSSTGATPTLSSQGLSITVDSTASFRPVIRFPGVLDDVELENAARSGLPLRVSLRVELWRDGFIDDLEGSEEWNAIVLFEPLDRQYIVRMPDDRARRFASFAGARSAAEAAGTLDVHPTRSGRFYYTATLRVETLSLSDLDELGRWLQGELQPAVTGESSIPGAIVQGAKRLLIRVLRLPSKQVDGRSVQFRV
jgi:hypothetical protein